MAKFDPDDALIRRLAALLRETGLSEIEYEAEGRRIRVGRNAGARLRVGLGRASTRSAIPTQAANTARRWPLWWPSEQ